MGDKVFDCFGSGEELACNVLGALYDDKGASWISDDDVALWYLIAGIHRPLWELQVPLVTKAEEGREEGKEDSSEQGHAVVEVDGYIDESGGT